MYHGKQKWGILFVFLFIILPILVKEFAQPGLSLDLLTLIRSSPGPFTGKLSGGFETKIFSDTRPHVGRIALLQKGLVLYFAGKSITGEGYGLGLPIVHKNGQAYLASKAKIGRFVRGDTTILSKIYLYDRVETQTEVPRLKYRKTRPVTQIRVDYYLYQNRIAVEADLRRAKKDGIDEIYFMNEVSGRLFQIAMTRDRKEIELLHWQYAPYGIIGLYAPGYEITVWIKSDITWEKFVGREVTSTWKWYGHVKQDWTGCEIYLGKIVSHFSYSIILQNASIPSSMIFP